jgi:sugar phosphate isomerase/epimerase
VDTPLLFDRLGVQAHCLRREFAVNFDGTLAGIASLGLRAIELVSFPGCRGNPWGDFGPATDLPPRQIARALDAAGLSCTSVMTSERELAPDTIGRTLDWVRATGCSRLVLTALRPPDFPDETGWRRSFERLPAYAEQCAAHGVEFGLHTQPELWTHGAGSPAVNLLHEAVGATRLWLEYDPTGAVMTGVDAAATLARHSGRWHGVHLRDGHAPGVPVPYLHAEPLGTGVVDWPALFGAARLAGVQWYLLEMEVADPARVWSALRSSLDFLRAARLVA